MRDILNIKLDEKQLLPFAGIFKKPREYELDLGFSFVKIHSKISGGKVGGWKVGRKGEAGNHSF